MKFAWILLLAAIDAVAAKTVTATVYVTEEKTTTTTTTNYVNHTIYLPRNYTNASSYANTSSLSTIETLTTLPEEVFTTSVASSLQPTVVVKSIVSEVVVPVEIPQEINIEQVTTSQPQPQPTTLITSATKAQTTSVSPPQTTESSNLSSFQAEILNAHNVKRAAHGVDPLSWSSELEAYAQNYASSHVCSSGLVHSHGPYGENLAAGFNSGSAALEAWYAEGAHYDYNSASSFDHFTQVIWKSSTELGCAFKDCSGSNWGMYIICSYNPPGNYIGQGKQNLLPPI